MFREEGDARFGCKGGGAMSMQEDELREEGE